MSPASRRPDGGVRREPFGHAPGGEPVELITLVNAHGIEMRVMTFGGIILSLRVPDRDGRLDDVVLGHDDVAGYLRSGAYFGALVGRYGNRIARGRFTLDGATYQLATNDGANHLHGGVRGFDKVVWTAARTFAEEGARGVMLEYRSADGEEGYPGTLVVHVSYTLSDDDAVAVDYHAITDRATPVNLTQHTYWNLAGGRARDILDHELTLHASRFTPVHPDLIPTGELAPVAGTPFDFRVATPVGTSIGEPHEQLRIGRGFDHNYVIDRTAEGLVHAARLADPTTGRQLDVHTTEPGVQFYSGNFLDGEIRGKGGRLYVQHGGLCLETQHFPDSPNQPHFPSTILRPDETFRSRTVFAFGLLGEA